MNYIDFYNKLKKFPLINLSDVRTFFPDFDHRRLYEWQKKGYLKKAVNNFYFLAEKKFSDQELSCIANKLYEPSYLSLEYALSYYSLIPETVHWLTSVSTKKTRRIVCPLGNFSYQKIVNRLYFGYKIIDSNGVAYKIAEPEKAILDFLYFRKDIKNEADITGLRINKAVFEEIIDLEKLKKQLLLFSSLVMEKKIEILLKIIKK